MNRGERRGRRGAAELNSLTASIIAAALEVHSRLGPGLLESAYEACLCFELSLRGLTFERQRPQPVRYGELLLDCGYRLDLLVEGEVVVEIKAVESVTPVHHAQLLTYLRLSQRQVGLLMNFNVQRLKEGISRLVNDFPST